ncbi:MAG: hypothetical protein Tsb005_13670 [Gammaproteobacteria bacterium]
MLANHSRKPSLPYLLPIGLLFAIFIGLGISTIQQQPWIMQLNLTVDAVLQRYQTAFLTYFMQCVSFLGDKKYLLPAVFLSGLVFYYWGYRRMTYLWWFNAALTSTIVYSTKHIWYSARPMLDNLSSSFPSGHVSLFSAVFLLASYLRSQRSIHPTRIYGFTLILILLMMLSRMYLNFHWLSDVLGGLALGTSCFLLSTYLLACQQDVFRKHTS